MLERLEGGDGGGGVYWLKLDSSEVTYLRTQTNFNFFFFFLIFSVSLHVLTLPMWLIHSSDKVTIE